MNTDGVDKQRIFVDGKESKHKGKIFLIKPYYHRIFLVLQH